MIRFRPLMAALLLSLLPVGAGAETFGALVMAPGHLKALPAGESLTFRHSRVLPDAAADAPPPAGGYRRLGAEPGQDIRLTAAPEGKLTLEQAGRHLAEFPASSPHPVLLMFLENVMRITAQETGGNPHYIRNRMRQSLGAAEVSEARLTIAPFEGDPNRSRFGDFAGLMIDIRWQPEAPDKLTLLSATLPDRPERYSEIFTSEQAE
ncbi:hypothetical protein [Falsigemmobacter faecalis]|uniref:Uncharacterized protein n=1 Tax=Falsigemmobacter faecalis TaxID=2488730 RepID=A0A3P3DD99_9RHOB|nr:hypothetical protein [Falsigemmobacter faecalis]RRH72303.1 hypothetical protein EG244_15085 [Falsigemmobacter faecalis]